MSAVIDNPVRASWLKVHERPEAHRGIEPLTPLRGLQQLKLAIETRVWVGEFNRHTLFRTLCEVIPFLPVRHSAIDQIAGLFYSDPGREETLSVIDRAIARLSLNPIYDDVALWQSRPPSNTELPE